MATEEKLLEKSLEPIKLLDTMKTEKGKSRLLSPDPKRKKLLAELLNAFATRKISFAELTRMDPKKIKNLAEVGFVKLRHGRYKEAIKVFEALTLLDHKNYFHHLALAGAYQRLNRFKDALFQYTQTLKYFPKNINALVNRGEIYLRMKLYRKAAEDFREAILQDKVGKNRYANRARSLVIAIKRSLAREKEIKELKAQGKWVEPAKKRINPFTLTSPSKKKST